MYIDMFTWFNGFIFSTFFNAQGMVLSSYLVFYNHPPPHGLADLFVIVFDSDIFTCICI